MEYEEALRYIHGRPRVKTPGHIAMIRVLERLGNPQDSLRYVHIAGTNGKGSCAAMCANVLTTAGYKTGLNISPFVIDFTERFSIDGVYISKEALSQITETVKARRDRIEAEDELAMTEFETVTSIAFTWFAREKCDVVCLEVGLGGRDDCTNVIKDSLVSCIMHISYDHTASLGETLREIASHKAGIIKPGGRVVCYPDQPKEALEVIKEQAEKQNAIFIQPDIKSIKHINTGFMSSKLLYRGLSINQSFTGLHQSYNACVVVDAMRTLARMGYKISDWDIKAGIETTKFPARIEVISRKPLIILDGGHNRDGIEALAAVLRENGIKGLAGVWATLSDKNPRDVISIMKDFIDVLYTVDLHGNRAVPREELARMASPFFERVIPGESVQEAVDNALAENKNGVLIFGSLYLASDARKYLMEKFPGNDMSEM